MWDAKEHSLLNGDMCRAYVDIKGTSQRDISIGVGHKTANKLPGKFSNFTIFTYFLLNWGVIYMYHLQFFISLFYRYYIPNTVNVYSVVQEKIFTHNS